MRTMRKLLAGSLLGVLLCVSLGSADLVTPRERKPEDRVSAQGIRVFTDTFKGHEAALVLVSGKGRTSMGLYVFDAAGNCVAKDDFTQPTTADDLFVTWIPPEQTRYSVEVRNGGLDSNSFQIALR
jgi:hypothetical protein